MNELSKLVDSGRGMEITIKVEPKRQPVNSVIDAQFDENYYLAPSGYPVKRMLDVVIGALIMLIVLALIVNVVVVPILEVAR